ncbi:response regulator [Oryzomonas rubra]|uniref:Response regulator transcription factor n=1 Tax=Oryzomonas rubra TaxID=2509454 RepID=A0A5A9X590_9BACT|nr:response regulator transcription factor [Oryzomonas rubra]KAA0887964.1 response regulator transcription factor [Oryzomonas rubra]
MSAPLVYKIFVVDDHAIVREGLIKLIDQEPDLTVCGAAVDAPDALKQLSEVQPDLAVVDITLASTSGLDLVKGMKLRYPGMPVLVFSMHDETIYAERALRAGAAGYIMKSEAPEVVISGIRKTLLGKVYLSERMTERLLYKAIHKQDNECQDTIRSLSDREFQVFQLIGKGVASRQIAKQLNLSVKTIDAFRENIKHKLGLKSASELVQYAIECVHSRHEAP